MATMSFATGTSRRVRKKSASFGTYLAEALFLLVCVLILLSVTVTLFAFSAVTSTESQRQQQAVNLAQTYAERFADDPVGMKAVSYEDDFHIQCDVVAHPQNAGTLYRAVISVDDQAGQAYQSTTSTYVSERNAQESAS
ncbi:MAG: hypothetical protein HFJ65_04735 [Eggerthellaceae bacterium]|nr:hypothetical protein [Eggerthellaceae bacterium]